MMHKYEIVIWWSEEDGLYLAKATELGCITHGDSPEAALREMNSLIPFYLEVLREENRAIPQPKTKRIEKAKTPAKYAAPLMKRSKSSAKSTRARKTHVETENAV